MPFYSFGLPHLCFIKIIFIPKEKLSAFKRILKYFSPETEVHDLTPALAVEYLREQAKTRSGYASNKDRKNLSTAWDWGKKFMTGFPPGRIESV